MNQVVKYRLKNVREVTYQLEPYGDDFTIPVDDCEVNFALAIKPRPKERDTTLQAHITFVDKRDTKILLTFAIEIVFEIFDIDKAFNIDNEKNIVNIPDTFLLDAINISVGTIRGMLVIRNANTYLNNIYFPLFNPYEILNGLKEKVGAPKIPIPGTEE